jgi:hypothetical protein
MKNIFKTTIFAFLLLALASCTNDNDPIAQASGDFKLLAPSNGTTYKLSPANASTVITTLVWDYANNGVQSASSYTIELAKSGTNFAKKISGGTTTDRFFPFTVEQLNGLLDPTDFIPYQEASVDVRIKSSLGTTANAVVQYSNVITLKLTPYSTALPKLYVPGSYAEASGYPKNWEPKDSPQLASSGFGKVDYEGYVFFKNANDKFKFTTEPAFSKPGEYAAGPTANTLLKDAGSDLVMPAAGYYRIEVDTEKLTYKATPVIWSVTGSGTPLGWPSGPDGTSGQDHDMTYNPTTKVWSITLNLTADEIKFRANDGWALNLGGFQADKPGVGETMSYGGANVKVPSAGNYTITLDLSSPRNYKYTLTKN